MPRAVRSEKEDQHVVLPAGTVGEPGLADGVTDQDESSPSLRAELAEQENLVRNLSRALWRAHERMADASADARAAETELAAAYRSTSWRLTAPLRLLALRVPVAKRLMRKPAKALWWTLTLQLPKRLRERRRAGEEARAIEQEKRGELYEAWIREYDTLEESDFEGMRELARALAYTPLVSIVMPIFDPPEHILREAIESVRAQVYERWELCIADDASTEPGVRRVLEEYADRDDRIRVVWREENGGISAASNSALALAQGELVGLLDHDDVLRPHALLLTVRAFGQSPEVAFVYSDEDKIDEAGGRRFGHYFKPAWNPALLLCQNYICHFSVFRTELALRVGGFRSDFDGSQDWDLALRITETLPPEAIAHVPHVLYHWRAHRGSAAASADAKPYAPDAGRRAVEDHLRRTERPAYLVPAGSQHRVRFLPPDPRPLVTAIVPSTGRAELLEPCLTGLLRATDYERLEVIVAVSDRDAVQEARRLVEGLASEKNVRVVSVPSDPFNYASTVNEAAKQANGQLLLMLNDDTRVLTDDWLDVLVGHAAQDRVGAVGALLLYPDGTIQHAGMLVGARGVAEHLYSGRSPEASGYVNRARLTQDLSVVAGTCMLVRREAFEGANGLDERFPVCYNDIDFCLRLRHSGWRVVMAVDAVLCHLESASFGTHSGGRESAHARDVALMRRRWGAVLDDDPMHNPNLALDASHPSRLAFPPRATYPWRVPS